MGNLHQSIDNFNEGWYFKIPSLPKWIITLWVQIWIPMSDTVNEKVMKILIFFLNLMSKVVFNHFLKAMGNLHQSIDNFNEGWYFKITSLPKWIITLWVQIWIPMSDTVNEKSWIFGYLSYIWCPKFGISAAREKLTGISAAPLECFCCTLS